MAEKDQKHRENILKKCPHMLHIHDRSMKPKRDWYCQYDCDPTANGNENDRTRNRAGHIICRKCNYGFDGTPPLQYDDSGNLMDTRYGMANKVFRGWATRYCDNEPY